MTHSPLSSVEVKDREAEMHLWASLSNEDREGFRPMVWCGAGAGMLVGAWVVFAPLLWGRSAWWPFDAGRLVESLQYRMGPAPFVTDEQGALYVGGALALTTAGCAVGWWRLRREAVLLALDVQAQERRVEHAEHVDRCDALWRAFELAERDGAPADRQLALLEQYCEGATMVSLTREVRADRTSRFRRMAREIETRDPRMALRILKLARALHRAGRGGSLSVWRVVRGDCAGYLVGLSAVVVGTVLVSLVGLTAVGLVMWVVKMVLLALVLCAIICALGAGARR